MTFAITCIILFSFWIIWSGKTDGFHLALGVISTLIVAVWSGDLLLQKKKISLRSRLAELYRFECYSFWLLWEIILANIQVIKVSLHPNLDNIISSEMVEFDSKLKTDMAQFILAQSITLTPGTVTVRLSNGTFLVHALTKDAAKGVPGSMLTKVAKVFGENS